MQNLSTFRKAIIVTCLFENHYNSELGYFPPCFYILSILLWLLAEIWILFIFYWKPVSIFAIWTYLYDVTLNPLFFENKIKITTLRNNPSGTEKYEIFNFGSDSYCNGLNVKIWKNISILTSNLPECPAKLAFREVTCQ